MSVHRYSITRDSQSNWFKRRWTKFWLARSGFGAWRGFCSRMAAVFHSPHKDRVKLSVLTPRGFLSHKAVVNHDDIRIGRKVLVDDNCVLFKRDDGGCIDIGDHVAIYRNNTFETGYGGALAIHDHASIHPRCQINAFVEDIEIGEGVMLAPACAVYSYNHGLAGTEPIRLQPLESRGKVIIGKNAWLGFGVIVTSGVTIGEGAVIGAGSVVSSDIPAFSIAAGIPARVIRQRD